MPFQVHTFYKDRKNLRKLTCQLVRVKTIKERRGVKGNKNKNFQVELEDLKGFLPENDLWTQILQDLGGVPLFGVCTT